MPPNAHDDFEAPPLSGQLASARMAFQLNLRRRGIGDKAVLRAMDSVPRENFVEPSDIPDAYRDTALGIACGQTISQPYVVAYMTEKLGLDGQQRVLEIGTGSGYQTAILARLAREVVTVERYRTLSARAKQRIEALGCDNVSFVVGDGYALADGVGDFDRIMVTAAMEMVPDRLINLLLPGGVMIAPVGPQAGAQSLERITRNASGETMREHLIDVRFVPMLPGVAKEL
jgi:protein-L-isoaspartate(D-aspartate) O-methyltransferase